MWWFLVFLAGIVGALVGTATGLAAGILAARPRKPLSADETTEEIDGRVPAVEAIWELEPGEEPTILAPRVDVGDRRR